MKPLRVLLLAEMCNPGWTSVPLVGYSLANALAARTDLAITLVTHSRNRQSLQGDPLMRSARVEFIDNEWLASPLFHLARFLRGGEKLAWTIDTAMMWPGYILFEYMVRRRFGTEIDHGHFDLIHRITPVSPTLPSPLAKWSRLPMILGPINGGLAWPREFPELCSQEHEWLHPLRQAFRLLPFHRSMYRHLRAVIVGSRNTEAQIPRQFRGRRYYVPENAIDPERFPAGRPPRDPGAPFTFLAAARLVPIKGFDMVIDAMAESRPLRQTRLIIVGDGPELAALEKQVRERGLSDCVQFRGWLAHRDLASEYTRADATVMPSLREFGGGAVMEAMACGTTPIVVDYGGPGEIVTETTGIKIPMQPRPELVQSLRTAMESLANDPEHCRQLGDNAAAEVRRKFTWTAKAERMVEIYREVLWPDGAKPNIPAR